MSTSTTTRRGALAAAIALALGSALATPAPAQAAEPVVTVTATPGSATFASDCKGVSRVTITGVIHVTVARSGDTADPLAVALTYSGTLAADSGLPATITIPAGASEATAAADEASGGSLLVDLVDGDGYAVGNPSQASTGIGAMVADLGCGIGSPYAEQTIEVGTTPAPFDVVKVAYGPPDGLIRSVEGSIPPGTTFHLDGTFTGTATEVGNYSFREYFCQDDGWCPYRADLRVIVVPAGQQPADDGPSSGPVTAAAATPVAGSPALTG